MWRYSSKSIQAYPVRPHHGMCLAFFKGNGYSDGFTVHMKEMLELFLKDVPVKLTVKTDEICAACPNNRNGECLDRQKVEKYDRAVLAACNFSEGMEMSFYRFAETVQEKVILSGLREQICGDCQWNEICRTQLSRWGKLPTVPGKGQA